MPYPPCGNILIICSVPKKPNPVELTDFHPIAFLKLNTVVLISRSAVTRWRKDNYLEFTEDKTRETIVDLREKGEWTAFDSHTLNN